MRKVFIILTVLWTALMSYLLLSPGSGLPKFQFFEGQDKAAHFILFGGWCFLLNLSLRRKEWLVFLTGLLVAVLTEWLQGYIPYRTSDFLDFVMDLMGVVSGLTASFFLKKELLDKVKKFDK